MTSLFNDNECYTQEATDLDRRMGVFLHPIVKEYLEKGYSTRDIEAVLLCAVNMTCAEERLGIQVKRSKERRNAKINF